MILENVDIYNLLPEELNSIIKKIEQALKIIKARKQTISKVAVNEKQKIMCPYCKSYLVIKNGHSENKLQNYMCKNCNRKFNDLTGTIFAGCHFSYEQLEIFFQCFRDKISLRKTASRMGINKNSVHLLRLKVLDAIKVIRENIKLNGDTELDEIYRSTNFKGTKKENMPRASKHRTSASKTNYRGISKHKVCIVSAIDEYDNCFFEIAGTGPVTSNMIKKHLLPKMNNVKKVITDCKSSYESIAIENNWNLKQVKSQGYVDCEGNTLANINSLHSGLATFLSKFRGVSTKHLQGYLDWFCLDKYLNYNITEESQNIYLLKNIIIKATMISSKNVYKNHSGIDFLKLYSNYNYILL